MHGLINRSLQCFLRDTYGDLFWRRAAQAAGLRDDGFEAMLLYDDAVTHAVVTEASGLLGKSRESLLEDMGTYLVCHPNSRPLRRLLRFSGEGFHDFLFSLDDLADRARLAVGDLALPEIEALDLGQGRFRLHVAGADPAAAYVLAGVLRAMADDYGALVVIDFVGQEPDRAGGYLIDVAILDSAFAKDKGFALASPRTASAAGATP